MMTVFPSPRFTLTRKSVTILALTLSNSPVGSSARSRGGSCASSAALHHSAHLVCDPVAPIVQLCSEAPLSLTSVTISGLLQPSWAAQHSLPMSVLGSGLGPGKCGQRHLCGCLLALMERVK